MLFELPVIKEFRTILTNPFDNITFFICLFIIIPISLITSLIWLIFIFRKLNSIEQKTIRMREINIYIQNGAKVYLKNQFRVLLIILAFLFVPVSFMGFNYIENPIIGFFITGLFFIIGAISSIFAGYVGMRAATKANILVLEATMDDPNEGFKLAYYGGMITGILNVSLLIFSLWLILILTSGNIYLMIGYSFGVSIAALLAQVGGGIYTKSADMAADLVGKYEMGIDEDDPSNPGIIADLVGDNVGDCAGRGADLYETASSDSIGGMVLGLSLFILTGNPIFIITNLTLISLGLFSVYFTTLFLKIDFQNTSKSIWKIFTASTLFNIGVLFLLCFFLFGPLGMFLFFSSAIGLFTMFLTIFFTILYTNIKYKHTRGVAEASQEGPSNNILSGLSVGLSSIFWPVVIAGIAFIATFFFGYYFGYFYFTDILNSELVNLFGEKIDYRLFMLTFGIWGLAMASASTDLIISTVLSFDTFGPIVDNAAGIAEMGGDEAPDDLREQLDIFDSIGNTTKAVSKGFALICGSFSSLVLLLTFLITVHALAPELQTNIPTAQLENIFDYMAIYNILIIFGLLMGILIPFLFSAMVLRAVQKGSKKLINEIRRQYAEIPGLRENECSPDYDTCIDIATKNALRYMAKPVLITIIIPIIVGVLLGPMVVGGVLLGNLIGCLILGLFFSIGGASFDNAKKAIETGLFGGKGSVAHKASIIGDTIGDPLKDTAGPSMNIIIQTVNTMALTFLPLFLITGYLWVLFPIL